MLLSPDDQVKFGAEDRGS